MRLGERIRLDEECAQQNSFTVACALATGARWRPARCRDTRVLPSSWVSSPAQVHRLTTEVRRTTETTIALELERIKAQELKVVARAEAAKEAAEFDRMKFQSRCVHVYMRVCVVCVRCMYACARVYAHCFCLVHGGGASLGRFGSPRHPRFTLIKWGLSAMESGVFMQRRSPAVSPLTTSRRHVHPAHAIMVRQLSISLHACPLFVSPLLALIQILKKLPFCKLENCHFTSQV